MKKAFVASLSLALVVLFIFLIIGLLDSNPPSPKITVEEKNIPTTQDSYCWNALFNSRCVDMYTPPGLVKNKIVVVSPGAKLIINFKKEPHKGSLSASIWKTNDKEEKANLKGNILFVPKEINNGFRFGRENKQSE
jgi:hypothetical protein